MAIVSQEVLGAKIWRDRVAREVRKLVAAHGFTEDVPEKAIALLERVQHTDYDDAKQFASDLIGMAIGEETSTNAVNALTTFARS